LAGIIKQAARQSPTSPRMKSIPDYDANFSSRAEKYREDAQVLRSATENMIPEQRAALLKIAQELEELADIIERLRFGDR
jgi:hypothetical protein